MSRPESSDPHGLQRFLAAQDGVYDRALSELRSGRKQSHWMWFVFPQIDGLGHSPTAIFYAIQTVEEAQAYLGHPVLGSRLLDCARAVLSIEGRSASEIMGYPDDLKLKSSMTLFEFVAEPGSVFGQVLDALYDGERDSRTLKRLPAPGRDR